MNSRFAVFAASCKNRLLNRFGAGDVTWHWQSRPRLDISIYDIHFVLFIRLKCNVDFIDTNMRKVVTKISGCFLNKSIQIFPNWSNYSHIYISTWYFVVIELPDFIKMNKIKLLTLWSFPLHYNINDEDIMLKDVILHVIVETWFLNNIRLTCYLQITNSQRSK